MSKHDLDNLGGDSCYSFNRDQLESLANRLMEQIETVAHHDGLISDSNLLSRNYVVTVVRPNVFTKLFDKVFMRGVESDRAVFRIMHVPGDLTNYDVTKDNDEQVGGSKKQKNNILSILDGGKKDGDKTE